jgi:hypothetical protein
MFATTTPTLGHDLEKPPAVRSSRTAPVRQKPVTISAASEFDEMDFLVGTGGKHWAVYCICTSRYDDQPVSNDRRTSAAEL